MDFPFIGPAYESESPFISRQRCVNWYLEKSPEGGRTPLALYPTPGMAVFSALPNEAQTVHVVNGRLFCVVSGTLYEVSSSGALTSRGSVANTGYAKIVNNGVQLLVLTGATAYVLALDTNVLTASLSTYLNAATECVVIDGYGVFAETGSQRVRITSPYDFLTVDPNDFASAEGLPDNIVAVASLNREVWLFGERSTEIWFNSGAADFPFERSANTFIEFGLAAPACVTKLDGSLYWIGKGTDGRATCLRANGYQPEMIAHHGIAKVLEQADKVGGLASAWAYSYHERGHPFYVITIPALEKTFAFDPLMGQWHERSYFVSRETNHPVRSAVTFNGKTICAAKGIYSLVELSEDYLTDLGNPIVRTRICGVAHANQKRTLASNLELVMQTGLGLAVASGYPGVNPVVKFRQSTNGGVSFGDWRTETAGAMGESYRRVSFRRLGEAINRVFEVQVSDPVKWVIAGATLDAKVAMRG